MEMDCGLGLSGGSRTKSNQRNIVLECHHVVEFGGEVRKKWWKPGRVRVFVKDYFFEHWRNILRLDELLSKLSCAQRILDLGLGENCGQLLRPEKRHCGDCDAAGLEHGKPTCRQHWRIDVTQ